MHKFWASALATAFVTTSLATGSAAPAAASPAERATPAAAAPATVKPPVPTTRRITCAIHRTVWSPCLGDNAKVAHGQRVYLALNSSAGRKVQFRVKDRVTGRVLSGPAAKRSPTGRFYLYWTNTTPRTVTIDVEARTTATTTARATLRIR